MSMKARRTIGHRRVLRTIWCTAGRARRRRAMTKCAHPRSTSRSKWTRSWRLVVVDVDVVVFYSSTNFDRVFVYSPKANNALESIKSPNSNNSSDIYDPAAPIESPTSTEDIPLPPPPPSSSSGAKPTTSRTSATSSASAASAQLLTAMIRTLVPSSAAVPGGNSGATTVPQNSLLAQIAQTLVKQQSSDQKVAIEQLTSLLSAGNGQQIAANSGGAGQGVSALQRAAQLAQQGLLPGVDSFKKPAQPAATFGAVSLPAGGGNHHHKKLLHHKESGNSGVKIAAAPDDVPSSAVDLNNRERVSN